MDTMTDFERDQQESYERDILGANDQGFCAWYRLDTGRVVTPRDRNFEELKEAEWESYISVLHLTDPRNLAISR